MQQTFALALDNFWVFFFMLNEIRSGIVLPAKSDSYVMFCLQSYQGLRIDGSLVY